MEVEGTFNTDCFPDLALETPPEYVPLLMKPASCASRVSPNSQPENASFDCNICLDFASDPVVTLCGHLYCWPCIYRWLHPSFNGIPRHCPVCKSPLSDSSLIPLYGRGHAATTHDQPLLIPDRPRFQRSHDRRSSENNPFYIDGMENHRGVLSSNVGVVLGEMAFAAIPWAFTTPPNSYLVHTIGEGTRWRRQEMRVESWLKKLWIFLLCSAVLCLILF